MDDKQTLRDELVNLESITKSMLDFGKKILETHATYVFDLYCMTILNRSVNLTRGYLSQIRDNNFISAAPLVRIHLDSLLRLFAAYQVDYNIDDFAKKVIEGQQINKLCDKHGKLMRDTYLANQIGKEKDFSWVLAIYKIGNSHVHFGSQHIFSSIKNGHDNNIIEGIIKMDDSYIPLPEKIGATKTMIQITIGINKHLHKWLVYKINLG